MEKKQESIVSKFKHTSVHFLFSLCLQQLYVRLSELLGPHDHLLILNVIVGKIATNLKCSAAVTVPCLYFLSRLNDYLIEAHAYFPYLQSEEVINHTLGLFSEMATGLVLLLHIYW